MLCFMSKTGGLDLLRIYFEDHKSRLLCPSVLRAVMHLWTCVMLKVSGSFTVNHLRRNVDLGKDGK